MALFAWFNVVAFNVLSTQYICRPFFNSMLPVQFDRTVCRVQLKLWLIHHFWFSFEFSDAFLAVRLTGRGWICTHNEVKLSPIIDYYYVKSEIMEVKGTWYTYVHNGCSFTMYSHLYAVVIFRDLFRSLCACSMLNVILCINVYLPAAGVFKVEWILCFSLQMITAVDKLRVNKAIANTHTVAARASTTPAINV